MRLPACQDNWRAGGELAIPTFPMKAADGSRNIEKIKLHRVIGKRTKRITQTMTFSGLPGRLSNRNTYIAGKAPSLLSAESGDRGDDTLVQCDGAMK
ncbi:hypothetical protein LSAT2_029977 [Lamellibrachia satsuma]|nr:hypothetical protein LSAT2_029977 [Lamellibrachia satsuma]